MLMSLRARFRASVADTVQQLAAVHALQPCPQAHLKRVALAKHAPRRRLGHAARTLAFMQSGQQLSGGRRLVVKLPLAVSSATQVRCTALLPAVLL